MYKIGDFSRLCQVSVKTLHHYDEVGLLRPAWVDRESGYRFYEAVQVAQVRRIRNLRALEFSLEEIAEILNGHVTSQSLSALLHAKREELEQLARETQDRLVQLDAWLRQIIQEAAMPRLDAVVKKVDSQLVASKRERITDSARLGGMFGELEDYIKRTGGRIVGPGTFINYETEYQEEGSDMETFYAIATPIPEAEGIFVYELPGVEVMASLIYLGAHDAACEEARQALATWIEEHRYRMNGPDRLVFLECSDPQQPWVVEFQYPVEKNA
jgi:DNA-binding transcriptional MerR regulator